MGLSPAYDRRQMDTVTIKERNDGSEGLIMKNARRILGLLLALVLLLPTFAFAAGDDVAGPD